MQNAVGFLRFLESSSQVILVNRRPRSLPKWRMVRFSRGEGGKLSLGATLCACAGFLQ